VGEDEFAPVKIRGRMHAPAAAPAHCSINFLLVESLVVGFMRASVSEEFREKGRENSGRAVVRGTGPMRRRSFRYSVQGRLFATPEKRLRSGCRNHGSVHAELYSTFFHELSGCAELICLAAAAVWSPKSCSYAVPSEFIKNVITPDDRYIAGYASTANPSDPCSKTL
jgi:hypothetical protein